MGAPGPGKPGVGNSGTGVPAAGPERGAWVGAELFGVSVGKLGCKSAGRGDMPPRLRQNSTAGQARRCNSCFIEGPPWSKHTRELLPVAGRDCHVDNDTPRAAGREGGTTKTAPKQR